METKNQINCELAEGKTQQAQLFYVKGSELEGKQVIELLERKGAKNIDNLQGTKDGAIYYTIIDNKGLALKISVLPYSPQTKELYNIFTLIGTELKPLKSTLDTPLTFKGFEEKLNITTEELNPYNVLLQINDIMENIIREASFDKRVTKSILLKNYLTNILYSIITLNYYFGWTLEDIALLLIINTQNNEQSE